MYINNRPVAAFYKLTIGFLSLLSVWFIMGQYGVASLRLFPTWVLFLSSVYFLSSSLYLAISHYKESGKNICPMLEGMLIMSFLLISAMAVVSSNGLLTLPDLPSWIVWLCAVVLPIMVLGDWLFFVKKGRWRPMGPFYWLALPVCYAATIVFTAQLLLSNSELLYPLGFLNFSEFGLEPAFWWIILIIIIFIAAGYFLYLADYAMSGKLSKRIVLPHLRVVDAEDDHANSNIRRAQPQAKVKHRPQPNHQPPKSKTQKTASSESQSKSKKSHPRASQNVKIHRQGSSGTSSASVHSRKQPNSTTAKDP